MGFGYTTPWVEIHWWYPTMQIPASNCIKGIWEYAGHSINCVHIWETKEVTAISNFSYLGRFNPLMLLIILFFWTVFLLDLVFLALFGTRLGFTFALNPSMLKLRILSLLFYQLSYMVFLKVLFLDLFFSFYILLNLLPSLNHVFIMISALMTHDFSFPLPHLNFSMIIISILESAINEVCAWVSANLLKLNPCWTHFMLLGLFKQLFKVDNTPLCANSDVTLYP